MDLPLKVLPPAAPHTHTVIFLHGRGDTTENFIRSLDDLRDSHNRALFDHFPSFRWVFPQAPKGQCISSPGQTMNQWFDLWSPADFSLHEELQAPGLRDSVKGVRAILAREAAALGGSWDHIILAGISQGAATGVHTLLNLPSGGPDGLPHESGLGAFLGFSCRMPFPGRTLAETRDVLGLEDAAAAGDDEVIRNTPMLLEHCVNDPLVLVEGGRRLRDTLQGFGARVSWREYPDGGHWFNSPVGVDDVVQFLTSVLDLPGSSRNSSGHGQVSSGVIRL